MTIKRSVWLKTLDFCPHSLCPPRLSFAFRNASSLKELFDNVEMLGKSKVIISSLPKEWHWDKVISFQKNCGRKFEWEMKKKFLAPRPLITIWLVSCIMHVLYCCCRRILCSTLVSTLLRDDNYEWHLQVPCWLYYIWVLDCYFLIWQ